MITLLGEPKSTNRIYKYVCRGNFPSGYMSKEGKELKESYQWQAKAQWKNKMHTCALNVDVKIFFGTKRKQDIDNFFKIVFDSLSNIVWEDDSQIQKLTVLKCYDKEKPRVELIIKEL